MHSQLDDDDGDDGDDEEDDDDGDDHGDDGGDDDDDDDDDGLPWAVRMAVEQLDEAEEEAKDHAGGAPMLPLAYTLFNRACTGRLRLMDEGDELCVVRFHASQVFNTERTAKWTRIDDRHVWKPLMSAVQALRVPIGRVRSLLRG